MITLKKICASISTATQFQFLMTHAFPISGGHTNTLDKGYAKRKDLYNLYHILNHCNLVGSSYLQQTESMLHANTVQIMVFSFTTS